MAPFAWRPVLLIAGAVVVLLIAVSSRYGWHLAEPSFYFRVAGDHLASGGTSISPRSPRSLCMGGVVARNNLAVLRLLPACS